MIENLLGLNMHSVDEVLPQYQSPQIGEGFGSGANRMRYERAEPERVLALRSVGSLVMERKMLRGIKDRAERLAREQGRTAAV